MPSRWIAFLIGISLLTRFAAAEWTEPADKIFTEEQLKTYLDTEQDWLQVTQQMMRDVADSKTTADQAAAVHNIDQKYLQCLEKHHISKAEFERIGRQALQAWGVVSVLDQNSLQTQDQLDSQAAQIDAKLADAQKRLAIYQDAQQDGIWVMTQQDRDAAIKSAKLMRQSSLDEAKHYGDDAAVAQTEANQHDTDAKSDDDLADHPPDDLSADDRASFIVGKKKDAQTARDAAGDARTREDDDKNTQAKALATAAAAEQKAAHPEVPQSDDDKAAAKSENDLAVRIAQIDMRDCQKQKVQISEMGSRIQTTAARMSDEAPPENVAIMRKYADRYKAEFQLAATQPSP